MTHTRFRRRNRAAFALIATLLSSQFSWASADTLWLAGNNLKLKTSVYESAKLSSHPTLIVVLHGDLLGVFNVPTTTYHYDFANEVSKKLDDVVVAAMLRPGYRDHAGDRSDGDQGMATGDNYTPEVVDAIAAVIEQLKAKFHPSRAILVGHSGGAAITGNLLGRSPSAVDGALLASCPCDLVTWRKQMMRMQNNNPIWLKPIRSLSPLELADKASPSVRVIVIAGEKDPVAPPSMSVQYAEALKKHNTHVTMTIAPALDHEILLAPVTYAALKDLVQALRESGQR